MKPIQRAIAGIAAVSAIVIAIVAYNTSVVRGSDHQDTYNLATRSNTSADITDVFVFPSPTNPANVVLAIDVAPLSSAQYFDPTLMWQIKISHVAGGPEDQVIQFGATGTGASQTIQVYGPAKPNEVGTTNTFIGQTGSVAYNTVGTTSNGMQIFAGPKADPFYIDLFALFSFLGDRNYATHTSQTDPGTCNPSVTPLCNGDNAGAAGQYASAADKAASPTTPSFNGFPAGTMSGTGAGAYACSTQPAQDTLTDLGGGFNVLTFVVEMPRALLTTGYSSQVIHVWATVNSPTGA
jgi:hypothetical protein